MPSVKEKAPAAMSAPVKPSTRLTQLPPYVFAELNVLKADARKRGLDLIDLGMGNPDLPTPTPILDAIAKAVHDPANHRYPDFQGKPAYRQAIARWMDRRYGVELNPDTEIQALIGSKEGIAHMVLSYLDVGDIALVSEPYYPVHGRSVMLVGGEVYSLPLTAENNFLPDLDAIPPEVAQKAKLLFFNYPNNPTAAVADRAFYEKVVAFCKKYQVIAMSDMAYSEITFDGYRPPSILQIPGAKDVAVEFHSFSKTFNMAGWRAAFVVGNAEVIHALFSAKTNIDYGIASAIQDGCTYALDHAEEFIPAICDAYQERRDVLVKGFRELGWEVEAPKGTLYLWLPIPKQFANSKEWCLHLMETTGVVITPGIAFGPMGDRYFRVSLVSPKEVLQQGIDRLKEKGIRYDG